MIKKFKIFEARIFNDVDPYGEERWGENEWLFQVESESKVIIPDDIDKDNLEKVVRYTMRSMLDKDTPHGAFETENLEKTLREYPDNDVVIIQINKIFEIKKQASDNYEVNIIGNELILTVHYKIEFPDFEDDDVIDWIYDYGDVLNVYNFNLMEQIANDERPKQYKEIREIFKDIRKNNRVRIISEVSEGRKKKYHLLDPYEEESWNNNVIELDKDESGMIFLNISKRYVNGKWSFDDNVKKYIEKNKNKIQMPCFFKIIDETDTSKFDRGWLEVKEDKVKIIKWG
jgi:hypothetical protein